MIKLIIPGQPCAKQRPRVFGRHAVTPQKTVNYETLVKELYISQYPESKLLEGPLKMEVWAYFQIPQSKPNKTKDQMRIGLIKPTGKPDWDNIGKIVSDALNGLAYHDDSQIVDSHVFKNYADQPRVVVMIWEAV